MPYIITIQDIEVPQRLDRYLKCCYPHISFATVQKWMRTGQIRLNGRRVEGAVIVRNQDVLRFPPQAELSCRLIKKHPIVQQINPQTLALLRNNILLETSDFLAINKPFGLSTQGGTGVKDALSFYLSNLNSDSIVPLRIIHRLDRDTSGVILLAKSQKAAHILSEVIAVRQIQKYYLAVLTGIPIKPQGIINLPIGKMAGLMKERMSSNALRTIKAITGYYVIDKQDHFSLVCFKPLTGRMHQLRVHSIESLKHPILGDGKYGGKAAQPFEIRKKMHLHAWMLQFHAFDNDYTITAPLPAHFSQTLKNCAFSIPDFRIIPLMNNLIER